MVSTTGMSFSAWSFVGLRGLGAMQGVGTCPPSGVAGISKLFAHLESWCAVQIHANEEHGPFDATCIHHPSNALAFVDAVNFVEVPSASARVRSPMSVSSN